MRFKFWKKKPVESAVVVKEFAAIFKKLNEDFYQEFVKFEKAYNEAYDALSVIEPVDTFDDNGYGEDWKW